MIAQPLRLLLLTGLCFFAALGVGRAAPADAARPAVETTNAAVPFPAHGFWTNVPGSHAWPSTTGLAVGRASTNSAPSRGGVGRPDKAAQPGQGNAGSETAFTAFVAPTPLLAHWRFDETGGTTAADSSGNNLHGTLSPSGASLVPGGKSGNALQLSKAANGYVNMGNVLGLHGGSFSLAVWVRMNAGDTTDVSVIVTRQTPGYHNGWFLNANTAGAPWAGQPNKALFYDAGNDLTGAAVSTTSINDGQWHHVVAVYQLGVQKRLYVDGVPVEGSGAANGFAANTAPFLVGGLKWAAAPAPTGYFTGWLDELMVFGTALTDAEISALFDSYVPTPPTAPTGLAAQAGNRQVTLTWSAATPSVTSYRVKRATAVAGPYSVIASPVSINFVDTGLDNGTTYYYRVSAVNVVGEGQDSAPVAAVPTPLLAHWRFDETGGTTAADSSGNNLHGTLSPSGASLVPGGKSGNALQLSKAANGYVNMGNVLGLHGGSFSLAVWVRMNAGDTTDVSVIVTRQTPGYHNGWFLNANTAGAPWAGQPNKALFYDAGNDLTGAAVSTTSINDGQWHHVVAVYQLGVQKRLYVDGVPVEGSGAANGFAANTAPFLVGGLKWAASPAPTGYFTGWLDELMVFNAALTDAEIGTLFGSFSLPNPPASLAAVPGDQQVSLSWSAVAVAASYTVKRSLSPGGPFTPIASPTAAAWTDAGLNNGTTYYYVVTAHNSAGESVPSAVVNATPAGTPTGPPSAPTGLTATAGNQQVTLSWSAVTPGVIAYNVKFAITAGGPYSPAGTTTAPATTFTHAGLVNGATYYYVVSAVSSMEGPNSTEASATPTATPPPVLPTAPGNLTATPGNQTVTLTWTAATPSVTRYDVKRSETPGGPYDVVGFVNAPGTSGVDNQNLVNGTTYYYVVTAVNAAGEADSAEVSATPTVPPTTPPDAPVSLTAIAGDQQVQLSWDSTDPNVTAFRVKRATVVGGPYSMISSVVVNSYVDQPLANGTRYYYVVSAVNVVGEGPNSAETSAVPAVPSPPTAQITSPASGATLSGEIQILGTTADDGAVSGTSLLIDGKVVAVIEGGNLNFSLDTSHFPNGPHTLQVRVQDNHGISYLGGDPNSAQMVNEAFSPIVTVTFQNTVRWLNPPPVFTSEIPIYAETDVFPETWTVLVEDSVGNIVRTLTGSTVDGRIETSWDGKNANGDDVPEEDHYQVVILLGDQPAAATSQSALIAAARPRVSRTSPARRLKAATYYPENGFRTATWSWRERSWNSGLTVLARQHYRGFKNSGVNGTVIKNLGQIQLLIQMRADELVAPPDGRYADPAGPYECRVSGSYATLLTALKNPSVRDFYYNGHCDGYAIGFSEGLKEEGIRTSDLASALINGVRVSTSPSPSFSALYSKHPYRFVFMDGCGSASGNLQNGFGIFRVASAAFTINPDLNVTGYKQRAYMGWRSTVKEGLLNNAASQFTLQFWSNWLKNNPAGGEYTVEDALEQAYLDTPSLAADRPVLIGYRRLKWSQ